MKTLLAVAILAGSASAVGAQTIPDLPRGDAWGSFGWALDTKPEEDAYRSGGNRRTVASAGGALYWAPHFKLEVDTTTPSHAAFIHYEQLVAGSISTSEYSRITYERWGVAAVQHYEFLSNAWFTPYVGLGVDVIKQTREEYFEPIVVFDSTLRTGRTVREAHEAEPERRTLVRPVAAVGFKAYMSRRAFFRSDTRVALHGGIDEVRIRFGFGVDF